MHCEIYLGGFSGRDDAFKEVVEVVPHLLIGDDALIGEAIVIEVGELEAVGARSPAFRGLKRSAHDHGIGRDLRHEIVAKRLDAELSHEPEGALVVSDLSVATFLAQYDQINGWTSLNDG